MSRSDRPTGPNTLLAPFRRAEEGVLYGWNFLANHSVRPYNASLQIGKGFCDSRKREEYERTVQAE